jgi:hypothetical protein
MREDGVSELGRVRGQGGWSPESKKGWQEVKWEPNLTGHPAFPSEGFVLNSASMETQLKILYVVETQMF